MSEQDRLDFIIQRDGLDAAIKFVEQGLALYIEECLKRNPAIKESIDIYKSFLQSNGRWVRMVVIDEKQP